MSVSKKFRDSGFLISPVAAEVLDQNFMIELEEWVKEVPHEEDRFRSDILSLQKKFNETQSHFAIARQFRSTLQQITGSAVICISGVAFLRVVRPETSADKYEYLGFHRESFYGTGDFVRHQINIHVPILGYCANSAMRYVPMSHVIPDSAFSLESVSEKESGVERGSTKHLGGMVYSPKKIIAGCDLADAVPVPVSVGQAFLFSSQLIHGGGVNLTETPRVSVDFAVIAEDKIDPSKNIQLASYSSDGAKYVRLGI